LERERARPTREPLRWPLADIFAKPTVRYQLYRDVQPMLYAVHSVKLLEWEMKPNGTEPIKETNLPSAPIVIDPSSSTSDVSLSPPMQGELRRPSGSIHLLLSHLAMLSHAYPTEGHPADQVLNEHFSSSRRPMVFLLSNPSSLAVKRVGFPKRLS
jgi:hypothetical protein